jgi:TonB-linked SusC/RagA family outer membrane protein
MQFIPSLITPLKSWLLMPVFMLAGISSMAQDRDQDTNAVANDTITVPRYAEIRKGVPVTGNVTDAASKRPLSAIRITYQDYSAAITDSVGNFTLDVPNYNVSIMVEGEGYQLKEIALRGRQKVTAALYEATYVSFFDAANLPFANLPANKVPFAATSVQTGGNWNRTAETPDAFLQGKIAGLNAIRRSGTPNIGANLFLRGITSLYTSNQPLIVLDGVIYDINDNGTSLISNSYTNPLAYIDVKDIDNITVLKDGTSTYGTKGGKGVILITTTRAKELATRIDFAVYGGVNFTPKKYPLLNAGQYRSYLSELLQSGGITESQLSGLSFMNDDPAHPDYYRYHHQTDWQNQVFDRSALQNYYLKVTGGDNIARYALSLGFLSNAGVIKTTDLSRYNTRFNADLNLSRRLTATANLSFTYNDQVLKDQGISPKTNPIYTALIKSPFIGVNEVSNKGVTSPDITDSDTFHVSNPSALINNAQGLNKNYRFFGSIGFNYSLFKSVTLSTLAGVTVGKIRESIFIPRKGVVDDTLSDGTFADSRLGSQAKRILSGFSDTRISYNQVFSRIHHVSARGGVRFLQSSTEQDVALGANSATDQLRSVGNGVALLRRTGGDMGKYNWLNTYLGADYSLSDKYFLSLNMAIDGSSRLGKNVPGALKLSGNSFAVLPSVAAAWLISSEKFLANSQFINLLKLRASYSLSGNDEIGNYNARQFYITQNFLGTQGLVRGNMGNDQLQWEKMTKINLGLDLAFFNERLNVTVDAYRNTTDNMITNEPLAAATGMRWAIANSGGLKTSGIEASITGRIINKQQVKWDMGVTLGHYRSVLTKMPQYEMLTSFADADILNRINDAPNVFFGYKTAGVYSSDAEARAEGFINRQPNKADATFTGGDMRFVDINGDKIIDGHDRQVIGDPNPHLFGSIYNRFEWKAWALEGLFTFTEGNEIYNYTRRQLESQSNTNNQSAAVINRWRNNGHVVTVPRAAWGDPAGNSRFSDRWIEDGSYLRLRTATLSYHLPINAGFLRYSVVYVTGNNLFTVTKYLGYDPEMSATPDVIGQGVDIALEPQYRSVQVGLRFGL